MHSGRGGSKYLYFARCEDFGGSGEEALMGFLGGVDVILEQGRVGTDSEWIRGVVFRGTLRRVGGVRFSQIFLGE